MHFKSKSYRIKTIIVNSLKDGSYHQEISINYIAFVIIFSWCEWLKLDEHYSASACRWVVGKPEHQDEIKRRLILYHYRDLQKIINRRGAEYAEIIKYIELL